MNICQKMSFSGGEVAVRWFNVQFEFGSFFGLDEVFESVQSRMVRVGVDVVVRVDAKCFRCSEFAFVFVFGEHCVHDERVQIC